MDQEGAVGCRVVDQVDHQEVVETQMEGTRGVVVFVLGTSTQLPDLLL